MEILVTGATGFIGGALCRRLINAGYRVRALHRPASRLDLLEGLPVQRVTGDLTDPPSLEAAVQGVDVIFHIGAALSGSYAPHQMAAVTVGGTRSLLHAARQAGVHRLVHCSSVAALGMPAQSAFGSSAPLMDERHAWNANPDVWPYGYAKYLAELEVSYAIAVGLDAVIVNPSVVLGAGDLYRQRSSFVAQVAGRRVKFLTQRGLNIVHVEDVVDGLLAACERGRCGERYILGGENIPIPALLKEIARLAGVPAPRIPLPAWLVRLSAPLAKAVAPILRLPIQPSQFKQAGLYFYVDNSKARRELGLARPRPLDQAIAETLAWFKAQPASFVPSQTALNPPHRVE